MNKMMDTSPTESMIAVAAIFLGQVNSIETCMSYDEKIIFEYFQGRSSALSQTLS
jgi:hypothetical protein